jgi:VAD1 Analog of StAR-related lipid transfer domain
VSFIQLSLKCCQADNQTLDLQMSDWAPMGAGSKLLTRNMSYIKPLNASMGPKQTKCEIKDEVEHHDLEQYVSTISSTRTPDVPSGGVFTVKTRTCVMWASAISSRVMVTTQVDWSGRSFIKGTLTFFFLFVVCLNGR